MAYGAPSDLVQSQLLRAARVLQADCEVVHTPGILLLTLGYLAVAEAKTDFIKSGSSLDLGKLTTVGTICGNVIADRIDVLEDVVRFNRLPCPPPPPPLSYKVSMALSNEKVS
jgi:uncharacterized membrane protein YjjP (DUF1212 family)